MDIANGGDYKLVSKTGKGEEKVCIEVWENIVERNAEATANYAYLNFFRTLREYWKLVNEYELITAILQKISHSDQFKKVIGPVTDRDKMLIGVLAQKGYVINFKDDVTFKRSVLDSFQRSTNIKTKITMKLNQLNSYKEQGEGQSKSFEEMMATLVALLGVNVDDNITLARYNEYRKIIKEKYKPRKK